MNILKIMYDKTHLHKKNTCTAKLKYPIRINCFEVT